MVTEKRSVWFGLTLMFLFLAASVFAVDYTPTELYKAGINLIPSPQEAKLKGDNFVLGDKTAIVVDKDASEKDRFAAGELAGRLREDWDIAVRVTDVAADKSIILTRKTAPEKLGEQGYQLSATADNITIRANGQAGLFYGTRSLLQIIQKGISGPYVRGMEITDWPDILQRAVHYDTKHHQDKAEYVRGFIRDLADYKINVLIWEWEDKAMHISQGTLCLQKARIMNILQEKPLILILKSIREYQKEPDAGKIIVIIPNIWILKSGHILK